MTITMKKAALLEKLRERLAAAEKEDLRLAKKHEADEMMALAKFRNILRQAMKWDWKKAKASRYNDLHIEVPSCPSRNAVRIKNIIQMISYSTAEKFPVRDDTDVYKALMWKPESERDGETVCD